MTNDKKLQRLLLANVTVLIVHQIDSAFWHEWELFGIPGGNQMNLLLNLPIIAVVLYAYGGFMAGSPNARNFFKLVAGLGFLTFAIHGFFYLDGREGFSQPMSIALIFATFFLSIWQLFILIVTHKSRLSTRIVAADDAKPDEGGSDLYSVLAREGESFDEEEEMRRITKREKRE